MNIDELKKEKLKPEKRLHDLINMELKSFNDLTGICVQSVYVNMLSKRNIGDKYESYIVGSVEAKIEL